MVTEQQLVHKSHSVILDSTICGADDDTITVGEETELMIRL